MPRYWSGFENSTAHSESEFQEADVRAVSGKDLTEGKKGKT
jgi:hypothetical protein